jgi:hypothetical protein
MVPTGSCCIMNVVDRVPRAIIDADDCRETLKAVAADTAGLLGEPWPIPADRAAAAGGIAERLSQELAEVAAWLHRPSNAGRTAGELADPPDARLDALRREWGHAYHIWWQGGEFHAMRRDNGAVCHCPHAGHLVREIQTDHDARPVLI